MVHRTWSEKNRTPTSWLLRYLGLLLLLLRYLGLLLLLLQYRGLLLLYLGQWLHRRLGLRLLLPGLLRPARTLRRRHVGICWTRERCTTAAARGRPAMKAAAALPPFVVGEELSRHHRSRLGEMELLDVAHRVLQ